MPDATWKKLAARFPYVLAVLVAVTYAPALGASWVWDDDVNVVTNGALRDLSGLRRIWTDVTVTQQYYPLTHTTFWLQYQTSGLWFPAYHAVNVALHATTAILLLFVLRRLAVKGAELGAALFALHPLNVESVAWVTERKNVLSGALVLGAVLAYLRFDEETERGRRRRWWVVALGLFLLALAAKTAVSVVPAALAVVLVLLRRRGARALAPLAPWFVAGAAAGLGTAYLEATRVGAHGVDFDWSASFRVLVAGRAFLFYLGKLLVPAGLVFFYPRWEVGAGGVEEWAYPAATAALVAAALVGYRRGRVGAGPLAALLCYGVLVFPALGFFNVYFMRFTFVQNHFAYLASMPVLAVVGAGVWEVAGRAPRLSPALAALPLGCAVLAAREAATFRDHDTLFRVTVARNPGAWVASYSLGLSYQDQNRMDDAMAMFRAALAVRPHDPEILGSLGSTLAAAGRLGEAMPFLREAAARAPAHAESRFNLGVGLELAGQAEEAIAEYREALRLKPGWTRAERQTAWLLATTDDSAVRDGAAAVTLAESACARTTYTMARCQDTLAAAYAATGDFDQAAAHAARAVELARAAGDKGAAAYEARARMYARREAYVVRRAGTTE